jgi:hypothetical protein
MQQLAHVLRLVPGAVADWLDQAAANLERRHERVEADRAELVEGG